MAVYRVQRTRDYTVMSNYHLKDKGLTLKSKGLLSMILSLPEEWNYTTRGLASICKEGVDAIGSALKELETAGYIVRRQLRGANGVLPIRSTSFTSSPIPRRTPHQIRYRQIRIHQIRKTRMWFSRIWVRHIWKCPQN